MLHCNTITIAIFSKQSVNSAIVVYKTTTISISFQKSSAEFLKKSHILHNKITTFHNISENVIYFYLYFCSNYFGSCRLLCSDTTTSISIYLRNFLVDPLMNSFLEDLCGCSSIRGGFSWMLVDFSRLWWIFIDSGWTFLGCLTICVCVC